MRGDVREKTGNAPYLKVVFVIEFMTVDAVEAGAVVGIGEAQLLRDVIFLDSLYEKMNAEFFQGRIQALRRCAEVLDGFGQVQYRSTAGGKVHFVADWVVVEHKESSGPAHP